MPMPRLTSKPSRNSCAARAAICSRVQAIRLSSGGLPRPGCALLEAFCRIRRVNDAFDENAGRDDVIGIDLAGLHKVFDLRDGDFRRTRHHRIEVPSGLAVDELAF